MPETKIILCVPGVWPTRRDVVLTIAEHSGGWLFAGSIMMETATGRRCVLEVQDADERLESAFNHAGYGGRVAPDALRRIHSHKHVLYAICDGGTLEAAKDALRVGAALLRSGGFAVKVETAGLAYDDVKWNAHAKDATTFDCYHALVTLVGDQRLTYSCGMHAFGLPEASCPGDLPIEEAGPLLNRFNMYQLVESPVIRDGETFSLEPGARGFRFRKRPCEIESPDNLFHNPAGTWHLEPL